MIPSVGPTSMCHRVECFSSATGLVDGLDLAGRVGARCRSTRRSYAVRNALICRDRSIQDGSTSSWVKDAARRSHSTASPASSTRGPPFQEANQLTVSGVPAGRTKTC